MWLAAQTTVQPSGDVVALAEAKAFLRLDAGFTADDVTVVGQVAAAIMHIQKETGLRFLTQTVVLRASDFTDLIHLPVGPVQSVSSVEYLDSNGMAQMLDPSNYEHFGADLDQGVRAAFNYRWPVVRRVADAVKVTAVVGYGAPADVPTLLHQAIMMLAADWYENREDTVAERSVKPETMPNGVTAILSNFRV
ncbi:head-tail connector protein [Sphingomonas sp. RT2P30]|uniref:head-tail connector protein n=1 Tax=Parasphingomonas halimpatiens TaxID=3096162 RepID=UPI002FC73A71